MRGLPPLLSALQVKGQEDPVLLVTAVRPTPGHCLFVPPATLNPYLNRSQNLTPAAACLLLGNGVPRCCPLKHRCLQEWGGGGQTELQGVNFKSAARFELLLW